MHDICVIGSGAGAAPIIYELSKAGHNVIVLEKGPWIKREQFSKDEIVATRRSVYTPNLKDERHVIAEKNGDKWSETSTYDSAWDFWNGSAVGGSSNFMSGYFHRLKPNDFKLLSTYGPIAGANIEDWPISYEDLEPYYAKVEKVVGVSGRVVDHKYQEPRSTKDFPFPPLQENIVSEWLDAGAEELGYTMVPVARAIISEPKDGRNACYYSNYCGSYGCFSGAKSSAREALINKALEFDCTIIPNAKVYHLETDGNNNVIAAWYYDKQGEKKKIEAKKFVVACQAIETSRLLLMSKNKEYPNGIGNSSGQLGKNLLFSAGGVGSGYFYFDKIDQDKIDQINQPGVFVNRSIQNFYEFEDEETKKTIKGGVVDFLWEHTNAVPKAIRRKWDGNELVYGSALKKKMKAYFTQLRRLRFEVFNDWLPTDDCNVSLDENVKDKWGDPVAKVKIGNHEHDLKVGEYLSARAGELLEQIGARTIDWSVSGSPPANLQAGGCRFGNDPNTSVLDENCKAHDTNNLYVTDGSFMPTGGSATYTFTIYANAFRVADHLLSIMK